MPDLLDTQNISEFGILLRRWRRVHGLSQLDLALAAESSARHISFIETGRSKPSREMVLHLCDVMELPLRERNRLLHAAGFSPAFKESPLDDEALDPIRTVLEKMLENHEPYPATVLNRRFDILMVNKAAQTIMGAVGIPMDAQQEVPNALRLALHPNGLRPLIKDWKRAAGHLIHRAHRQLRGPSEDDPLAQLLEEVLSYPDIPTEWRMDDPTLDASPVLPLEFVLGEVTLSWITTITSFGTPQDVTAEEIMIESMFPANIETEQACRQLTGLSP
ncbi:helix-turn-helix domain-containing protein [Sneathiella aquimaris]|uniref:helix-turn-helix domain-containing protein n=1 Tax=Sneathiella aquimaris TaxID=2599305 RepID=UPI001469C758|nr:helix-turn-helix transcriptional regulator [Sneathiella aquimaris]